MKTLRATLAVLFALVVLMAMACGDSEETTVGAGVDASADSSADGGPDPDTGANGGPNADT